MSFSISQLLKATQLTGKERLMDATRLIQRALGATPAGSESRDRAATANAGQQSERTGDVVDVPYREVSAPPANDPDFQAAFDPVIERQEAPPEPSDPLVMPEPPAIPTEMPEAPPGKTRPASFRAASFAFGDTRYAYRLYLPPGMERERDASYTAPPALVVLLHGCKQDAADFAKGTAMNALAAERNCLVLYPEQLTKANQMRCWNWFEPGHQSRDAGEPAMIAALTQQVVDKYAVDRARVYVAGLSAGGAMAALVANLYPELFAAAGVHSGLPAGAANTVMGAFSAMRSGAGGSATSRPAARPTPVIVFHGSADKTVNPANGDQIREAALGAFAASQVVLTESQVDDALPAGSSASSGRRVIRSVFSDADGTPYVEHWSVAAGPHAWSGGHGAGSYTDPDGPDASRAMLDFFMKHRLNPVAG